MPRGLIIRAAYVSSSCAILRARGLVFYSYPPISNEAVRRGDVFSKNIDPWANQGSQPCGHVDQMTKCQLFCGAQLR